MVGSDGAMGDMGARCVYLGGLAGGASLDKGGDKVFHVRPPVVLCEEKASF